MPDVLMVNGLPTISKYQHPVAGQTSGALSGKPGRESTLPA